MSVDSKAVVSGTLYWPFLKRYNPMKEGKYTVDLGNLDKKAVKQLEDMGLTVKTDQPKDGKPDRGKFIILKTGYPCKVVDKQRRDVDGDIVGNGTVANVRVTAYSYPKGPTWAAGTSGGFNAIQVTNLVEFTRGGGMDDFDFDADDEGFDDVDEYSDE
tara:strand:+ start:9320 stop:9793 length:474 start_codon:yes stop_codon:yes gene_type:complete